MASRPSPLESRPASEPAEGMVTPRKRRRRNDRPRFTYRLDPGVHQELHRIKSEVEAGGDFRTTIDQLAEDLLQAGIDAFDRGEVEVSGQDLALTTRRSPGAERT